MFKNKHVAGDNCVPWKANDEGKKKIIGNQKKARVNGLHSVFFPWSLQFKEKASLPAQFPGHNNQEPMWTFAFRNSRRLVNHSLCLTAEEFSCIIWLFLCCNILNHSSGIPLLFNLIEFQTSSFLKKKFFFSFLPPLSWLKQPLISGLCGSLLIVLLIPASVLHSDFIH